MHIDEERLQKKRLEKANSLLESLGLEAIIATAWDNIRFLTDSKPYVTVDFYIDTGAAILPVDGDPAIIGGLQGEIAEGVKILGKLSSYPYIPSPLVSRIWGKAISKALQQVDIAEGKIGIDYLPIETLQNLKNRLKRIEFIPILKDILRIRAIKMVDEIKLVKKAASIVDTGMQKGLDNLKIGVSERKVCAEIFNAMFMVGSEMVPWTPCCTCGGQYADLKPTDYRLKEGDSIRWDVGAMFKGYIGDASRTGFVGTPDEDFRKLYSCVYKALMNGIKAIKPGNRGSDVDFAARSTLQKNNYPAYAMSMGHGIGMRVYEFPWIAPKEEAQELDMRLEPGMVMSLEPESYSNNKFVRLEDMILVTESGNEILTKTEYLLDFI